MRLFPLLLLTGLAACDAAGPGFRGADKTVSVVDGSQFTLRHRGDVVEAIRSSPELLPRFPHVARRAAIAAQIQTGCRAEWVQGDPSKMLVGLACEGRRAPKPPRKRRELYCDLTALTMRDSFAEGELSCSAI